MVLEQDLLAKEEKVAVVIVEKLAPVIQAT